MALQASASDTLRQDCHAHLRAGSDGAGVALERIRQRVADSLLSMSLAHLTAERGGRGGRAVACLRKESVFQNWSGQWEDYDRYLFAHDASGRLVEELRQAHYPWGWVDTYRETHTYATGQLATSVLSYWDGSVWNDMRRLTRTYEGNLLKTLTHAVNDFGDWEDMLRIVYEYDGGLETEWRYEWWTGSSWSPEWRATLVYDSQNRLNSITEQYLEYGSWLDSYRYLYLYGDSGRLAEIVEQLRSSGQWINDWRVHYMYDAMHVSVEREDYWLAGQWHPTYRALHTYNGHLLEATVRQPWTGSQWYNEWRDLLYYGPGDNLVEEVTQGWTGAAWANGHRLVHQYEPFLSSEPGVGPDAQVSVAIYPNPV